MAALAVSPLVQAFSYASGALGNTAAVLGIWSFAEIHLPGIKRKTPTSRMRVVVGLSGSEQKDTAGDCPDIRLWGETFNFLGMEADPGFISEGGYIDVIIDQKTTEQPTYALLSGNKNGVCIAYLLQTWPDEQKYGWVGNWGRACGQPWYHSNILLDGKSVECTWIDANAEKSESVVAKATLEGIPSVLGAVGAVVKVGMKPANTGLQVHFPEFNGKGEGYNKDPAYYCNHTTTMGFRTEDDPHVVTFLKPSEDSSAYGRRSTRRSRIESGAVQNSTWLIKSSKAIHTATDLCQSETSRGPDFVSLVEGRFCDMGTKKLWLTCKDEHDKNCFDLDADDIRVIKQLGKRDGPVLAMAKSYEKVTKWD